MQNAKEKSFDFYLESTKQLITVASGIITFSVVFSKDFIGMSAIGPNMKLIMIFAWLSFLVSIASGIWAINALAGQLDPGDNAPQNHTPSIWAKAVNNTVMIQQIAFGVGIFLVLLFGGISIFQIDHDEENLNQIQNFVIEVFC